MFKPIIIDCQTPNTQPNCEDCIARRTCTMNRSKPAAPSETALEPMVISEQLH